MADNTVMDPTAGPVNADPVFPTGYFATQDSFGFCGNAGMVLATVNPLQRATRSISGENFCAYNGQTIWLNATDAVYMKRDGVITY